MTFYKVLNKDGTSPHQNHLWSLPKRGKPGKWVKAKGPLRLCANGVHLCDGPRQLLDHLGPVIYEAEIRGDRIDGHNKIAVREARLTRRVEQWNERTARLFAVLCAEHVLPNFESKFPNDDRPRKAIEAARMFADGLIDSVACSAARSAAGAAVDWERLRPSAYSAGHSAARWAGHSAAYSAAHRSARWAAHWAADLARSSASNHFTERDWQAERLAELLTAPGDWTTP